MGVYITGMEMPKDGTYNIVHIYSDGHVSMPFLGKGMQIVQGINAVPVPPHGRLIDADALEADLRRQCNEVFKIDAVSPDDFWITRNQAYNERLWKTWCESFYDYLDTRATIIPAEEDKK